jgi:starch synthase
LAGAFDSLMQHDLQVVVLGTGEARYQTIFADFRDKYPNKTGIFLSYDYELAHKIFAGADMLLVPSRYEPCGLNQLYSLKYGTVPIVRATGGLTETVEEFSFEDDSGTGFKFSEEEPTALEMTILKAVSYYLNEPSGWKRLMMRGMNKDFSWNRSAREYLELYKEAIQQRRNFISQTPGNQD